MTIHLVKSELIDGVSDKEWLEMATSRWNDQRPELGVVHGAIAADGIRVHILSKQDSTCKCGHKAFHDNVNQVIEATQKAEYLFTLNRKFLIEALAGMYDGTEGDNVAAIAFYRAPGASGIEARTPVILKEVNGERAALIMVMTKTETDDKLQLPAIQEAPRGDEESK